MQNLSICYVAKHANVNRFNLCLRWTCSSSGCRSKSPRLKCLSVSYLCGSVMIMTITAIICTRADILPLLDVYLSLYFSIRYVSVVIIVKAAFMISHTALGRPEVLDQKLPLAVRGRRIPDKWKIDGKSDKMMIVNIHTREIKKIKIC